MDDHHGLICCALAGLASQLSVPDGFPVFDLGVLIMCQPVSPIQKSFTWFNDPGHAWLEVERADLLASGVAGKISHYSYQKGDTVFLEEDCDASTYLNTLGFKPEFIEEHTNNPSPIRRYSSFSLREGEI